MAVGRSLSASLLQTLIRQKASKGLKPLWDTFGEAWSGNALPGSTIGLKALQDDWINPGSQRWHCRHASSAHCDDALRQARLKQSCSNLYSHCVAGLDLCCKLSIL